MMGKRFLEVLLISVLVAGVAGVFIRAVGAIPISVTSTAKQNTFDVSGQGKVVVAPDQAEMTLGVRKEAENVAKATEQVDQTMKQLTAELKSIGIDQKDIKTVDYSVYPKYSFDARTTSGYTVNSSVLVTIKDLNKAGQVVDLVGKLGLEQSGGLNFTLSDELREKTTKQAREQAINNAKKKASELSSLAGMNLGRIVNVQENNYGSPVPYLMNANVAESRAAKDAATAEVNPGTSEVDITVTLSYETR